MKEFNPYQPLTLKEITSWKPKQPPYIISDGLLPKGHIGFIQGDQETWKSWLVMDLAFASANGLSWLLYKTKPAKIIILNPEIPAAAYKKRIEAFQKQRNLYPPNNELLRFWTDLDLRIDENQGRMVLLNWAKTYMPDLFIIDGLEFVCRGDLSTGIVASAMRDTINQVRSICGCSFLIVHHKKKGAYDAQGNKLRIGIDEMYGHSIIKNLADTILMIEKDMEDEEVVRVHTQKTRMSEANKPPPVAFKFDRKGLKFELWV